MKVILGTSYIDVVNGIDAHDGDELELDDEIAATLVERGSATPVAEAPAQKRTTRTKAAPETRG